MSRARMAWCCCAAVVMLVGCQRRPKCLYTEYERVLGSVTIASSRDLERFEGRCILVRGSLRVEDPDAVDLSGLEGVVGVGGSLRIVGARSLESTSGLESLEFVGHDLEVVDDASLAELDLPTLRSVGGTVELGYLPALGSLVGMPVLSDVGRDVFVHDLPALQAWDLEAVEAVGGDLRVETNPTLVELDVPDTLFEVGGSIEIVGNLGLESVGGFDGLDRVGGSIIIASELYRRDDGWEPPKIAATPGSAESFLVSSVTRLQRVAGFERIVKLAGILRVRGADNLVDMEALPKLERVHEISIGSNPSLRSLPHWRSVAAQSVTVEEQPEMVDLAWFSGVVAAYAYLSSNPDLRSLDGLTMSESAFGLDLGDNPTLQRLGSITVPSLRYLGIGRNPALTDIEALRRVESVDIAIYIFHNTDLDQRHAEESVAHLEPQETKKVAANQGWLVPEECPWVDDGECDEGDDYGPPICRLGTDGEDCAP